MKSVFKVDASGFKFTVDGNEYAWFGGFGAVFVSLERGVKEGDLRKVGNVIFHAYQVRSTSSFIITRKRLVSWSPVDHWSAEDIRDFRLAVFKTDRDIAKATGATQ